MRSRAAISKRLASAWAWRSASSWSRNVAIVSSLAEMSAELSDCSRSVVWSAAGRGRSVVWSASRNTKTPENALIRALVVERSALYASAHGLDGDAQHRGGLRYGEAPAAGLRLVLSHEGDSRPLGPGPKALRSHPRGAQQGQSSLDIEALCWRYTTAS